MSYANKAYDMELITGYRMVSWGHIGVIMMITPAPLPPVGDVRQ